MTRLLIVLAMCFSLLAAAGDPPSLLDYALQTADPPVFDYTSKPQVNQDLEKEATADLERMGFNGSQEIAAKPRPGWKSLPRLYGPKGAENCQYLDKDGKLQSEYLHLGDLYAPESWESMGANIASALDKAGKDSLIVYGDKPLAAVNDEIDAVYSRHAFTRVSSWADQAWRRHMERLYGDASPGQDSNNDGRNYNADSSTKRQAWAEVVVPRFKDRFSEPRLWTEWCDFNSRNFYDYFTRAEQAAAAKGVPCHYIANIHGSFVWPGGNSDKGGGNPYYQAKYNSVLIQECNVIAWPFHGALAYGSYDRLCREYGKPVFGWSWFWPARQESPKDGEYTPDAIERSFAQIFAHDVHGLLFWIYEMPFQRNSQMAERIAFWHHWYRSHWSFLKNLPPPAAEIALMRPETTTMFYDNYRYPKQDYGWTAQALLDLQFPFTVVTEREIIEKGVAPWKALLIPASERVSAIAAARISEYIAKGGHVYADVDSLSLDEAGQPLDLLRKEFGVKLERKFKAWFQPTMLDAADAEWVERAAADHSLPPPARTPYGAKQTGLDFSKPQLVEMRVPWSAPALRTYHDIVTATAEGAGKTLATHGGEAVMVETPRTLWCGFRVGGDICATYPKERLSGTGEPTAPYWDCQLRSAAARAPYVDIFKRFLERAGVTRPVTVTRQGRLARNVNAYAKADPKTGAALLILVDADLEVTGAPDEYLVSTPLAKPGFQAWDMVENRAVPLDGSGGFVVRIPEHRAKFIALATAEVIKGVSAVQTALLKRDLTARPFTVGPRGGAAEAPVPAIRGASEPAQGELPESVIVQSELIVANPSPLPLENVPAQVSCEVFAPLLMAATPKGVSLDGGRTTVQWDDLDGDGRVSVADELVWQISLAPGEAKRFTVSLLAAPAAAAPDAAFAAAASDSGAQVSLNGRRVFAVDANGDIDFSGAAAVPAIQGFVFGVEPLERKTPLTPVPRRCAVVADGPVRKTIELVMASPDQTIESSTRYSVYRLQPEREVRVYAVATHQFNRRFEYGCPKLGPENFRPGADDPKVEECVAEKELPACNIGYLGSLFSASRDHARRLRITKCLFDDALGRLSDCADYEASANMENNFGGWMATSYPDGGQIQVSLRRVRGVLDGPLTRDEHDGLQAWFGSLRRAQLDNSTTDQERLVDLVVEPGTRWRLDTLLAARRTPLDAQASRAERQAFASAPVITVEKTIYAKSP